HLGTPTQGANWSRISQPNPTPFDPDKTDYAVWDYVVYNSKPYYLRETKLGMNIPGTEGSTWQELTEAWVPTNIYRNPSNNTIKQMVHYGGAWFIWDGPDYSNSLTAPGTERNGWTELTEVWRYY